MKNKKVLIAAAGAIVIVVIVIIAIVFGGGSGKSKQAAAALNNTSWGRNTGFVYVFYEFSKVDGNTGNYIETVTNVSGDIRDKEMGIFSLNNDGTIDLTKMGTYDNKGNLERLETAKNYEKALTYEYKDGKITLYQDEEKKNRFSQTK